MKISLVSILVLQLVTLLYTSANANNVTEDKAWKIVNGREVNPRYKYPYQAFFAVRLNSKKLYKCGGTIIGRRHIITAAHCITKKRPTYRTYVIVGEHRITVKDAFGFNSEAVFGENIIRVVKFLKFKNQRRHNRKDIGMLELERDIEYSHKIKPACIPAKDAENYAGRDVVVTGWGGTIGYSPGSQPEHQVSSDVLMETTLRVQSPDSRLCKKTLADTPDKLCAYRQGTDTCQGDSGGPMTVKQNGRFVLIGITSSGMGCAADDWAGVYVRVSYFHDWIVHHVKDVCISGDPEVPSNKNPVNLISRQTGRIISSEDDNGNKDDKCVFPFIFKGKTNYECTLDAAKDGIPWCSTKVDGNGVHIKGKWRHCEPSNGGGGASNPGCETGSSGDRGAKCVFPFIFKGKTYSGCTLEGAGDGIPWCSTKVDRQGVHKGGLGKWRHCRESCVKQTARPTYPQKQNYPPPA